MRLAFYSRTIFPRVGGCDWLSFDIQVAVTGSQIFRSVASEQCVQSGVGERVGKARHFFKWPILAQEVLYFVRAFRLSLVYKTTENERGRGATFCCCFIFHAFLRFMSVLCVEVGGWV